MDEFTINAASKYVELYFNRKGIQLSNWQYKKLAEIALEFVVMFPNLNVDDFFETVYRMYMMSQPKLVI